VIFNV